MPREKELYRDTLTRSLLANVSLALSNIGYYLTAGYFGSGIS